MIIKPFVTVVSAIALSACLIGCFSRTVKERVVQVPVTQDIVVHESSNPNVVVERIEPDGTLTHERRKITDDDMKVMDGHREQLVGKLQERYGYAREKAEKEAEKFAKDCGC